MLMTEGGWLCAGSGKVQTGTGKGYFHRSDPLYEEAERNKLIVEVQALSVVKSDRHRKPEEFAAGATSEEASRYLKETMGCLRSWT